MSWDGAITNDGVSVLAQWSANSTLHITGASVSVGSVQVAALKNQTALSGTTHPASIVSQSTNANNLTFKVQVRPDTSGYTLRQVGIFGYVSGSAKLIGIWQESDGISIPASSSSADYVLNIDLVIGINNTTGTLDVTIDTSTYVSNSVFQSAVSALSALATTSSNGLMSSTDKAKLNELSDAVATTSVKGLMSATDKAKLDGIQAQANKYTHPTAAAKTGYPQANQTPDFGGAFTVSQVTSSDGYHVTGLTNRSVTIPATEASASAKGLMTAANFTELANFALYGVRGRDRPSATTLNSYTTPGVYFVYNNNPANDWPSLGSDTNSYSLLLVIGTNASDGNRIQILFTGISDGSKYNIWFRSRYSSSWKAWKQVYPPQNYTPT